MKNLNKRYTSGVYKLSRAIKKLSCSPQLRIICMVAIVLKTWNNELNSSNWVIGALLTFQCEHHYFHQYAPSCGQLEI